MPIRVSRELIYGEAKHLSLGSLESIADRPITINGLGKAYALTGWGIGYACAPGAPGAGGAVARPRLRQAG